MLGQGAAMAADTLNPVPPGQVPDTGTFYLMSRPTYPPLPIILPTQEDLDVYFWEEEGVFLLDDRVAKSATAKPVSKKPGLSSTKDLPPDPGGGGPGCTNCPPSPPPPPPTSGARICT
jgi:hypothetical protein